LIVSGRWSREETVHTGSLGKNFPDLSQGPLSHDAVFLCSRRFLKSGNGLSVDFAVALDDPPLRVAISIGAGFAVLLKGTRTFIYRRPSLALRSNPSVLVNPGTIRDHWGLHCGKRRGGGGEEDVLLTMTALDDLWRSVWYQLAESSVLKPGSVAFFSTKDAEARGDEGQLLSPFPLLAMRQLLRLSSWRRGGCFRFLH
jgi:hypothetical protein